LDYGIIHTELNDMHIQLVLHIVIAAVVFIAFLILLSPSPCTISHMQRNTCYFYRLKNLCPLRIGLIPAKRGFLQKV
jgi:hypothetical protein